MKKSAFLFTIIFAAMCMTAAWAAPVVFDESTEGDLPDSTPFHSSLFFILGVGSNTFSATAGNLGSGQVDFDYIGATIPTNRILTELTFSITDITDNGTLRQINISFDDPNTIPLDASESFTAPFSVPFTVAVFESVIPLAEGGYYFGVTGFSGTPLNANVDYTWTFNGTAVPIPSAVWLFGAGIISLAVARKKSVRPRAVV